MSDHTPWLDSLDGQECCEDAYRVGLSDRCSCRTSVGSVVAVSAVGVVAGRTPDPVVAQ